MRILYALNCRTIALIGLLILVCICNLNAAKPKKPHPFSQVADFDDIIEPENLKQKDIVKSNLLDISSISPPVKQNSLYPFNRYKKFLKKAPKFITDSLTENSVDESDKSKEGKFDYVEHAHGVDKAKNVRRRRKRKHNACNCMGPNCPKCEKQYKLQKVGHNHLLLKLLAPRAHLPYQKRRRKRFEARNKRNNLDINSFANILKYIEKNKTFTEDYTLVPIIFATLDDSTELHLSDHNEHDHETTCVPQNEATSEAIATSEFTTTEPTTTQEITTNTEATTTEVTTEATFPTTSEATTMTMTATTETTTIPETTMEKKTTDHEVNVVNVVFNALTSSSTGATPLTTEAVEEKGEAIVHDNVKVVFHPHQTSPPQPTASSEGAVAHEKVDVIFNPTAGPASSSSSTNQVVRSVNENVKVFIHDHNEETTTESNQQIHVVFEEATEETTIDHNHVEIAFNPSTQMIANPISDSEIVHNNIKVVFNGKMTEGALPVPLHPNKIELIFNPTTEAYEELEPESTSFHFLFNTDVLEIGRPDESEAQREHVQVIFNPATEETTARTTAKSTYYPEKVEIIFNPQKKDTQNYANAHYEPNVVAYPDKVPSEISSTENEGFRTPERPNSESPVEIAREELKFRLPNISNVMCYIDPTTGPNANAGSNKDLMLKAESMTKELKQHIPELRKNFEEALQQENKFDTEHHARKKKNELDLHKLDIPMRAGILIYPLEKRKSYKRSDDSIFDKKVQNTLENANKLLDMSKLEEKKDIHEHCAEDATEKSRCQNETDHLINLLNHVDDGVGPKYHEPPTVYSPPVEANTLPESSIPETFSAEPLTSDLEDHSEEGDKSGVIDILNGLDFYTTEEAGMSIPEDEDSFLKTAGILDDNNNSLFSELPSQEEINDNTNVIEHGNFDNIEDHMEKNCDNEEQLDSIEFTTPFIAINPEPTICYEVKHKHHHPEKEHKEHHHEANHKEAFGQYEHHAEHHATNEEPFTIHEDHEESWTIHEDKNHPVSEEAWTFHEGLNHHEKNHEEHHATEESWANHEEEESHHEQHNEEHHPVTEETLTNHEEEENHHTEEHHHTTEEPWTFHEEEEEKHNHLNDHHEHEGHDNEATENNTEVLNKINTLEKDLKLVNEVQSIIDGIKENYSHKGSKKDEEVPDENSGFVKRGLLMKKTITSEENDAEKETNMKINALGKLFGNWKNLKSRDQRRTKRFLVGNRLHSKQRNWQKLNNNPGRRFLGQRIQNF